MKKRVRVPLALGIGFGLAILSMAIAIYFGYVHAYSSEEKLFDAVSLKLLSAINKIKEK